MCVSERPRQREGERERRVLHAVPVSIKRVRGERRTGSSGFSPLPSSTRSLRWRSDTSLCGLLSVDYTMVFIGTTLKSVIKYFKRKGKTPAPHRTVLSLSYHSCNSRSSSAQVVWGVGYSSLSLRAACV